jgi:hypothetical protein
MPVAGAVYESHTLRDLEGEWVYVKAISDRC